MKSNIAINFKNRIIHSTFYELAELARFLQSERFSSLIQRKTLNLSNQLPFFFCQLLLLNAVKHIFLEDFDLFEISPDKPEMS